MIRLLRLWRLGARDIRFLWYALRHPSRPMWLFPAAALLAFYALEPLNFAMPLFGVIDDFLLLPLVLHWMARLLPAEIRVDFEHRSFAR
ncbi:MAG TPA: hypothetical protein VHY75_13430 [Steroidobacteraceae bacterium]|nr:hypothetical protein [Steroidobacteraceae bacterium]